MVEDSFKGSDYFGTVISFGYRANGFRVRVRHQREVENVEAPGHLFQRCEPGSSGSSSTHVSQGGHMLGFK
jgi:hypothetical protein